MGIINITIKSTVLALLFLSCFAAATKSSLYDVVRYGAVGDGKTDDSDKFLKAWTDACADSCSPTFIVPSGKTFLLSQITFEGPCKSSINVRVLGDIVAPNSVWGSPNMSKWITFKWVDNLTISGKGQIDGRGSPWWDCRNSGQCDDVPDAFALMHCNHSRLSGLTFVDAPAKHVSVYGSRDVVVHGLTIISPEESPNTDGMHVQKSQHVKVTNCSVAVGDDCIAVGTGSSAVKISHMKCGPGHGISIGSLGRDKAHDTVEHIKVSNCNIFNTTNGVRIKTWQGGSGYAKNISFQNINFTSVENPIIIDQYYCPEHGCQNSTSAVELSDIRFVGLRGTSTSQVAVKLACSESKACSDIYLEDINLQHILEEEGLFSLCLNAHGEGKDEVFPSVPCLR